MFGTYFNEQLKWQGQVRFDSAQGFTLIDRTSKAETQIPIASVVRIEPLPMPGWAKLLGSYAGIFGVTMVIGWIGGAILQPSTGVFWSGIGVAIAMLILNFFKPVFSLGQAMQLHTTDRAPSRIQMPMAFLKEVRSKFPQWLS